MTTQIRVDASPGLLDYFCRNSTNEDGETNKWLVEMILIPNQAQLEPLATRQHTLLGWDRISWSLDITVHFIIETSNIHTLMQEGFFITEGHVQHDQSYYIQDQHPRTGHRCHGWSFTITDRLWTGELRVCSRKAELVQNFRVASLSAELVECAAVAKSGRQNCGDVVYQYIRGRGASNINVMCSGESLIGLWPWPRREEQTNGKEPEREQHKVDQHVGLRYV